MALSGHLGGVSAINLGSGSSFTDEPTQTVDNKTFTITNKTKRHFDPDSPITVKVNGNVVTTGFYIEEAIGSITFENAQAGAVTISGSYLIPTLVGGFYEWGLDESMDAEETTTFESNGNKEYTPTLYSFTGSASSYFTASEALKFPLGEFVLLKFYIDETLNVGHVGYGIVTSKNIAVPVGGIIESEIEIQGVGKLYYFED